MSSSAFYIGLSGLNSFSTAISVTSDNIANASTTGFKASNVLFGDLVSNYYASGNGTSDRLGAGSSVLGTLKDFTQGSINSTATWTDVALNGDGFFSVKLADDDTTYYTRDGSFSLDKDGYLVTSEGYQVLGTDNNPIQVDTTEYSNLYVDSTGTIFGTKDGASVSLEQTLMLTQFSNQNGLIRSGSNKYLASGDVGTVTNNDTGTVDALVEGCALEMSNTDLSSEMVDLIIYQADYNASSKIITTANEMVDTVVGMVR